MHRQPVTLLACSAVAVAAAAAAAQPAPDPSALERALLADAGTRTAAQPEPTTAGHDGRFFLASPDGRFRLQVGGDLQCRYIATIDADDPDDPDSFAGGFQLNRARLDLQGNALDPRLAFRMLAGFDRDGGAFELEDAYAEYAFQSGLTARWGQFKLPFDREFFAASATQTQTIERSIVSSVFRLDRTQGLQLGYGADRWRVFGALSDGRRALNTTYDDPDEADLALTARAEFRLGQAAWRQFRDQPAFRGDKRGVLLGVAAHWQSQGATGAPAAAGEDSDLFAWTADASYEDDGWNILGAVTGRAITWDPDSYTDWGALLQAGIFITEHAEFFARYAIILPDGSRSGGNDAFTAITGGVNYYFFLKSHAAKLTGEMTLYPDTQADSASLLRAPDTGIGLGPDSDGAQVGLAIQMQVVF